MNATGIKAFDSTMHTTNVWLNDLADQLGYPDKQCAYQALRVVLHGLRDHLPLHEAVGLGAQLPMLVRGFYYEGWHPAGKPIRQRKKDEFLFDIAAELPIDTNTDPEDVVRAVFHVLSRHVSAGEIAHVLHVLPTEIRSLWVDEPQTVWF